MKTLLDTVRVLASFAPPKGASLSDAPWEDYVDWAIGQGLAPLAAYNLEYRLGGAGAPEWARDRMLSVYQGSLNDNVMKLVNFKRSIDALEGMKLVLLGGASFAESLYPHVAFRPVLDIELLARPKDVEAVTAKLAEAQFRRTLATEGESADHLLTDGRTRILLYTRLFGDQPGVNDGLFDRALPMKVYGPSMYRLDLEDAVLVEALGHASSAYEVPLLSFVDFRELWTGATSMGGPYSRPLAVDLVQQRATQWGLEGALYCSASIVERLFPEADSERFSQAKPKPGFAMRQVLDRAIVRPVSELAKGKDPLGAEQLRKLVLKGLIP